MQLAIFIFNDISKMDRLLSKLLQSNISGATLVPCEGLLQALSKSSIEPPPIFGSLRQYINMDHAEGRMMFVVLADEQVDTMRALIREVTGGLNAPNTGIFFTIPLSFVEGVANS